MADKVYCACGCGTPVMFNGKPMMELEDSFIYEADGTLDYIELFVPGHAGSIPNPANIPGLNHVYRRS